MTNVVVYEYGLGDAIVTTHCAHKVFNTSDRNILYCGSFRKEYIAEFLNFIRPYLPPCEVHINPYTSFSVSYGSIIRDFPKAKIYNLYYGTRPFDYQVCSKTLLNVPFDYTQIPSSTSIALPPVYGVISPEVLGGDRLINPLYWKRYQESMHERGITPIIIGKKPINAVDIKRNKMCIDTVFEPEPYSLDLREQTSFADIFHIIKTSQEIYCTCNAIAVLAYELKKNCTTFGVRPSAYRYNLRFFPKPYDGFNILYAEGYR